MTTQCVITFDNNPEGVYYGGQVLSGTVKLTTVKAKTIRAVYITVDGRAKVRWTEQKSRRGTDGKTHHYTETYSAHEQYLSSRTYVLGNDRGTEQILQPGIYTYTFQVLLPPQIPSSFVGRHGSILYDVTLTIDRPWRFDNEFRQPFTVIYHLDLNTNPNYKLPVEASEKKEFWCGCCNMQPMIVKGFIPLNGYAPGQKIPITIFVDNESGIDCQGIKIKLHKIVQFTARHPHHKSRYDTVKIFEKLLPQVLRQSRKEYKDHIPLPSIAPSTLESCGIIHVNYNIEVTAKISGCHRNADINLPITIGTVPLYESATNPANVITIQPTAPVSGEGGDSPPAYAPMKPPTYEDATVAHVVPFEDNDEEKGHIKEVPFTPKYPVYYNFATPSAPAASSSQYNGTGSHNNTQPYAPATTLPNPSSNENTNTTGQSTTTYGWAS